MNTHEAIQAITSSERFVDCSAKYPPVSNSVIQKAEDDLGHPLPDILRSLFSFVANGGFGPGYGIIGLEGGYPTDEGVSSVELYTTFSRPDPDDPYWKWPAGLLPLCHWGCAIYSCVDCSTPDGQIVWFDPNAHDLDETWAMAFRKQSLGLVEFLLSWANGQDHWKTMYDT
jgi:hypothetical protein